MSKVKRFSVREAIAEAFGLDFADVENDYRYQPGSSYTPCAVYSLGEHYYTATKTLSVKPKGGLGYLWSPFYNNHVSPHGWCVWIASFEE